MSKALLVFCGVCLLGISESKANELVDVAPRKADLTIIHYQRPVELFMDQYYQTVNMPHVMGFGRRTIEAAYSKYFYPEGRAAYSSSPVSVSMIGETPWVHLDVFACAGSVGAGIEEAKEKSKEEWVQGGKVVNPDGEKAGWMTRQAMWITDHPWKATGLGLLSLGATKLAYDELTKDDGPKEPEPLPFLTDKEGGNLHQIVARGDDINLDIQGAFTGVIVEGTGIDVKLGAFEPHIEENFGGTEGD